jgi:hypothetical protein
MARAADALITGSAFGLGLRTRARTAGGNPAGALDLELGVRAGLTRSDIHGPTASLLSKS